jgi:hypothetical protein
MVLWLYGFKTIWGYFGPLCDVTGPDGKFLEIFDLGGLGCASIGVALMPSAAGRVAHCPIRPALAVLFALFRA